MSVTEAAAPAATKPAHGEVREAYWVDELGGITRLRGTWYDFAEYAEVVPDATKPGTSFEHQWHIEAYRLPARSQVAALPPGHPASVPHWSRTGRTPGLNANREVDTKQYWWPHYDGMRVFPIWQEAWGRYLALQQEKIDRLHEQAAYIKATLVRTAHHGPYLRGERDCPPEGLEL